MLVYNKTIEITGVNSVVSIYSINGVRLVANKKEKYISLENFDSGIYIVQYSADGIMGTLKIFL